MTKHHTSENTDKTKKAPRSRHTRVPKSPLGRSITGQLRGAMARRGVAVDRQTAKEIVRLAKTALNTIESGAVKAAIRPALNHIADLLTLGTPITTANVFPPEPPKPKCARQLPIISPPRAYTGMLSNEQMYGKGSNSFQGK